jgi:hypothetical protein
MNSEIAPEEEDVEKAEADAISGNEKRVQTEPEENAPEVEDVDETEADVSGNEERDEL